MLVICTCECISSISKLSHVSTNLEPLKMSDIWM